MIDLLLSFFNALWYCTDWIHRYIDIKLLRLDIALNSSFIENQKPRIWLLSAWCSSLQYSSQSLHYTTPFHWRRETGHPKQKNVYRSTSASTSTAFVVLVKITGLETSANRTCVVELEAGTSYGLQIASISSRRQTRFAALEIPSFTGSDSMVLFRH